MLTDKEIIEKIQYFRAIQPNSDWVSLFHQTLKAEMGKTIKNPSFQAISSQTIFGKMLRPVPLFATAGVLGALVIFVIIGVLPGGSDHPLITGNLEDEGKTVLVQDSKGNGDGESNSREKNFSVVVGADEDTIGSNVRTIVLGEENGEFQQELFNKVSEKLKRAEEMVSEISTVSDVRQTKELLDKAKEALSNGNLADAFDVLVALERLLER